MQTHPSDIVLHIFILHCSLYEHLLATHHLSYNTCLSGGILQTHSLSHENTGPLHRLCSLFRRPHRHATVVLLGWHPQKPVFLHLDTSSGKTHMFNYFCTSLGSYTYFHQRNSVH